MAHYLLIGPIQKYLPTTILIRILILKLVTILKMMLSTIWNPCKEKHLHIKETLLL